MSIAEALKILEAKPDKDDWAVMVKGDTVTVERKLDIAMTYRIWNMVDEETEEEETT